MYQLPGGSCAQWFSGSASVAAVVVALGANFYAAWRQRQSDARDDAAEIAGISMLLRAVLQETSANVDILQRVRRTVTVWDQDYSFCTALGAVKAIHIPSLSNKQADVLFRIKKIDLATSLDQLIGNVNLINMGIEEVSQMRSDFDPFIEEHFKSGTKINPSKEDEKSHSMLRKLKRISKGIDYFSVQSRTSLKKAVEIARDFNSACVAGRTFNLYKIDIEGYETHLEELDAVE